MSDFELPRPRKVILVADDQESGRELVRAILGRSNYVVVEAADGEQALQMSSRAKPDLIILDIHMPKHDGFAVVNELRKDPIFQSTPIMALTASGSLSDQDRITASGFDACLVKPIGPAKLRETVALLLLQSASTV